MQTFLPYPDFAASAQVLDTKRLGNQCYRECVTLVRGKWPNHPASKMWRGRERWLCLYSLALVDEMEHRGSWGSDVIDRWREFFSGCYSRFPMTQAPKWLGDPKFHAAHRSNLLRKDPIHYGKFGWIEPDNLEYIWPTP